jgi:chloramphenicol-sensitive protein RarD
MEERREEERLGYAYTAAVYVVWGFMPAYWKLLAGVEPGLVLAHRAVWGLLCVAAIILIRRRPAGGGLDPRGLTLRDFALRAAASLALAVQWIAYLLAVVSGRLVEMSLGYFIYPLVVGALGAFLLKERLPWPQLAALGLAGAGVALKIVRFGSVPVLALVLACSFAAYSLAKKRIKADAATSILSDLLFLAPVALGVIVQAEATGRGAFSAGDWTASALLAGGGLLTAATLLLFAAGARRVPLFALGLLQYISPTMVLLLGVLAYGEPFGPDEGLAFGLIWAGLAVSIAASVRARRR